jgi:hypothetical protein
MINILLCINVFSCKSFNLLLFASFKISQAAENKKTSLQVPKLDQFMTKLKIFYSLLKIKRILLHFQKLNILIICGLKFLYVSEEAFCNF